MAPVCAACRLSLPTLCVFVLCVIFNAKCQLSSGIRSPNTAGPSVFCHLSSKVYGGDKTLPPFLSGGLVYLCRTPAPPTRRKRPCRRGKRSGRLVRMKASSGHLFSHTEYEPRLSFSRRFLDPVEAWLVPVVGPDEAFLHRGSCSPRPPCRRVNLHNLRSLCRAPRTSNAADRRPLSVLA